MKRRNRALDLLEQTKPTVPEPCIICGSPALDTWKGDGKLYCLDHWPDLAEGGQPAPPTTTRAWTREQWAADPRPDITADSAWWERLLGMAYDQDGDDPDGLFGALHGLRCGGAKLLPVPPDKTRLSRGEWDADEYAQLRDHWLLARGARLTDLLGRVRRAS